MNVGGMDSVAVLINLQKTREALQALYEAMPTGYGNDRALNEALIIAEKALGIERKVSHV